MAKDYSLSVAAAMWRYAENCADKERRNTIMTTKTDITQAPASAEPIYQVFHTDGTWEDLDADSYANSEDAGREVRIVYAAPVAQEPLMPWRGHWGAIDAKALSTAQEIALMWGADRSQFVSRIQVAVIEAMLWMRDGIAAPVAAQAQHPDDAAVDAFAAAMKTKLAQKRAEGRGGWEDKAQCSQDRLSLMLRGHVAKGDPVDVGNFCMMLHQRGERISDRDAASPSAQDREDAAFEAVRQQLCRLPRYSFTVHRDGIAVLVDR